MLAHRPPVITRRLSRLAAVFAALATFGLADAAAALAESCVYDGTAKSVTATISPGSTAALKVVGGELHFGPAASISACGAATTTNTDSISVTGASGSTEVLILDQRGGFFGPGAAPESNQPEIEMSFVMGDLSDSIVIYGTEGDDHMAPGQNGIALDSDGDLDIEISPSTMLLEFHGLGGVDYINGRGEGGAGLRYLGPLKVYGGEGDDILVRGSARDDVVDGGPGNDVLDGQDGNDVITGGPGDDTIGAGGGDDDVTGGPGADSYSGSSGNDTFHAVDEEADLLLNGGPDVDTVYYDDGIDPNPTAVENKFPVQPPPPPAGACDYSAATAQVTATLAEGDGPATLKVVGGAIHFGQGAALAPCGAATTTNTDQINVVGTPGVDQLTIDESGGWFVPGATPETDTTSEIEIAVNLGESTDQLTVIGASVNDNISIGQSGLALNADGDRDVTWAPRLDSVTAYGMGGKNTITALGGAGSGSAYAGQVFLFAGAEGDTLRGSSQADTLTGGAGNDTLDGRSGADTLDGAGGNDTLQGADGADVMTGGPGADSFSGSDGADTLYANDGEADTNINGGPLTDTAYYDEGIDPNPVAVEIRNPT
jgi:Ca2+-binding RTX toxin-like protein